MLKLCTCVRTRQAAHTPHTHTRARAHTHATLARAHAKPHTHTTHTHTTHTHVHMRTHMAVGAPATHARAHTCFVCAFWMCQGREGETTLAASERDEPLGTPPPVAPPLVEDREEVAHPELHPTELPTCRSETTFAF